MASSAIQSLAISGAPNSVNDGERADYSNDSKEESESIKDSWSEYGDYEVWLAAREMLGEFSISITSTFACSTATS
jgi:hypothetical protein